MPRWSSWSRWTMPRSNIPRCRTGIRATPKGKGGIYNFVTKRGACRGARSQDLAGPRWRPARRSPGNIRPASCAGDDSVGEFYSVAMTNNCQQADTGTKMIHLGSEHQLARSSPRASAPGRSQQHLSRPGAVLPQGDERAQLHPVRLAADRRRCGAHTVPYIESRNPTAQIEHEATTSKIADDQLFYCRQRGLVAGGRGGADRQRLLQGSAAATADGIRRRGAEAAGSQPGRLGGLRSSCWRSRTCHAAVERQGDPQGHRPDGAAGRGACDHGAERLGQVDAGLCAGGPRGLRVTDGSVTFDGDDLLALAPEERAAAGVFLAFQYPVEIPGVSNANFLRTALNAQRRARGESELDAVQFLKLARAETKRLAMPDDMLKRAVNVGFSGGEKKRNEILQMAILRPKLAILDETDCGLDIDALKIVADGVNALRAPDFAALVITHYQRLLDYIVPDRVHVLAGGRIVAPAARNWRWSWKPRATPAWSRRRHDRCRADRRRRASSRASRRCAIACPVIRASATPPPMRSGARACRGHVGPARGGLEIHQPAPAGRRGIPAAGDAARRRQRTACAACRASMRRASCSSMASSVPNCPRCRRPSSFARFADHAEFGTLARPDSEPLVALNTMLAEDGASLSVPAGVDAGAAAAGQRRDRRGRVPSAPRDPPGAGRAPDAAGTVGRRRQLSAQSGLRGACGARTPR